MEGIKTIQVSLEDECAKKGHSINGSIQSEQGDGVEIKEEKEIKKVQSWWSLFCLTSWTMGLTFGWNAMFVMGTPLFKQLGLNSFWTSMAWLAGPLSGFIFQPICGVLSDRSTSRYGRRRPFILFGAVMGSVGMLLFAYPAQLSRLLHGGQPLAITLAILALWVMNIGLNIIQGPAWALLFDLLPAEQQASGNAVLAVLAAVAGL